MFLTDARDEQFFESLIEVFFVITNSYNTILDDVGHNFFFSSTFYLYSRQKAEMLHLRRRFFVFFDVILYKLTIFGP